MEILYKFIEISIICAFLYLTIAKPILDELKTIKEKLDKLNEKNQDEPKE